MIAYSDCQSAIPFSQVSIFNDGASSNLYARIKNGGVIRRPDAGNWIEVVIFQHVRELEQIQEEEKKNKLG